MLTEKDYCDYDTCVALKELRYNEKCHGYYEPLKRCFNTTSIKHGWCNSEVDDIGVIICPTLYEAQKWLREEKGIGVFVSGFKNGYTFWVKNLLNEDTLYQGFFDNQTGEKYKSYEEAFSEGIKKAVKILKENEDE